MDRLIAYDMENNNEEWRFITGNSLGTDDGSADGTDDGKGLGDIIEVDRS
eukprot:CAMPEP_0114400322 /NCGR_PEP_ID=MMETSP0102-20121206/16318_1 /TAXON_ID=38822 ORGANISM="Pteridomonas danica, Strain PT" /NCGR_SAMPLE_ID=MMETSP0102 /ASSEMBLY_ACC=CAM_ASM_000212 /LENGTH=49 /DNA_ID=CAMNT_0001562657 /DNA_START=9 /DNA_END=158 /DNA_ORIENTATION=-